MRKTLERAIATFSLIALAVTSSAVIAGERDGRSAPAGVRAEQTNSSVLTIPANSRFPLTKQVGLGAGKSLMVQFPTPLKDVLVADPLRMDAVVQSSNQVFLIAKSTGSTNAFFFDQNGQQILTLEVTIGADLGGLESLLKRLLPGSSITIESAGKALVLLGNVRTPIDSQRASDIARQFVKSTGGVTAGGSPTQTLSAASGAPGSNGATTINLTGAATGSGSDQGQSPDKPIINMLSVDGEEQVQLRVHVAEVSRSVLKQLGINLGAQINAGNFVTSLLTSNSLPLTAAAGLGTLAIPGIGTDGSASATGCASSGVLCNYNQGPQSSFGGSGFNGATNLGGGNKISHALQALEREGLIRTLAEPNLTAVSGEAAKFLAGGEYPIPTVDATGNVSVSYKEFGVGVAFTPIVMSEGRISLKIETEVSELSTEGAVTLSNLVIPALKKRQAKSTVELPSGGSIALAGLISDKTRQNIDGFPGLKDVPVLGTLFRSRDFIKEETELVIIVTPYLVRPTSRQNLSLPNDGLAEASDLRANLLGHLNRVYGKNTAQPVGDLKGDYGFIVD